MDENAWTLAAIADRLETMAAQVVGFGQLVQAAYILGAVVTGFVIALIVNWRAKGELQRVPYFVFTLTFAVVGAAAGFTWFWGLRAMENEVLWVIVAINLITSLLIGYGYGAISAARSRDAFNANVGALIALIPFLNLFLIFWPSRQKESPRRINAVPVPRGWFGVFLGLLLLGLYVALDYGHRMQARITAEEAQKTADPAKSMAFLIRTRGLEETLEIVAREGNKRLPVQIDKVTRLATLSADGKVLSRTYIVSLEEVTPNPEFEKLVVRALCAYKPFVPLLREGATIEEIYKKTDGTLIAKYTVTQEKCDALTEGN
ncbi:MAG: hypothetical protein ACLFV8_14460 [Alphaproteobacteria bacterium]